MILLNRSLTALQRSSMRKFGMYLLMTIAVVNLTHYFGNIQHLSRAAVYGLSGVAALPIVGIMLTVSTYLRREGDEYVRMLVVQSLLWGLGVTMVANTSFGVLSDYFDSHGLLPVLNIDLFCITAMLAMRVQLWRSR